MRSKNELNRRYIGDASPPSEWRKSGSTSSRIAGASSVRCDPPRPSASRHFGGLDVWVAPWPPVKQPVTPKGL
eukprot:5038570-Pyramimonas_sp.AAC.1